MFSMLIFHGTQTANIITSGTIKTSGMIAVTKQDKDGKFFPAIEQYLQYFPGLRVLSKYSVGRIANIDVSSVESDKMDPKAFTYQHIYKLLAKLPAGLKPNVVFLPYKAALLLAASRATVEVATTPTGQPSIFTGLISPVTEFEGIPFVPTDSIKIGETKN